MCKRRLDKHSWATLSIATVAMIFLAITIIVTVYDQWSMQTDYERCIFNRINVSPYLVITDTDVEAVDRECRLKTGYKGR